MISQLGCWLYLMGFQAIYSLFTLLFPWKDVPPSFVSCLCLGHISFLWYLSCKYWTYLWLEKWRFRIDWVQAGLTHCPQHEYSWDSGVGLWRTQAPTWPNSSEQTVKQKVLCPAGVCAILPQILLTLLLVMKPDERQREQGEPSGLSVHKKRSHLPLHKYPGAVVCH